MPEAQQLSVYFLMGELSEAGLPRAYIGQSGNIGNRLVQYNQNKVSWNRALVVISSLQPDANTRAVSGMVCYLPGYKGRALQSGERQHRLSALHARAAASRLPRDSRDRRHPVSHAGPAHL